MPLEHALQNINFCLNLIYFLLLVCSCSSCTPDNLPKRSCRGPRGHGCNEVSDELHEVRCRCAVPVLLLDGGLEHQQAAEDVCGEQLEGQVYPHLLKGVGFDVCQRKLWHGLCSYVVCIQFKSSLDMSQLHLGKKACIAFKYCIAHLFKVCLTEEVPSLTI